MGTSFILSMLPRWLTYDHNSATPRSSPPARRGTRSIRTALTRSSSNANVTPAAEVVDVATLFLTNRECPFRCLMCDLWKNTLTEPISAGDIPEQIRWASQVGPDRRSGPHTPEDSVATQRQNEADRATEVRTGRPDLHPNVREIKLYNSGNFFDRKAIPADDYAAIAELVRGSTRSSSKTTASSATPRACGFGTDRAGETGNCAGAGDGAPRRAAGTE